MPLPRLVAFDVDGTLITFGGECSERTRSAVAELRRAGVAVALATGRPLLAVPETVELVGPMDFAVTSNGSSVVDLATGRSIRSAELPGRAVVELVRSIRGAVAGVGVAIEAGEVSIEEAGFGRRLPPRRPIRPVDDVLVAVGADPPGAHRVIFFHDDYDADLDSLAEIVGRHIDETCGIFYGQSLPLVEVHPAGENKGVGLAALAAHLGIEAADVMVFGDGTNDIEMFEWAGTAVAMGDSRPALLPSADHVTGTVTEDGVAEFLEPLLRSAGRPCPIDPQTT